MAPEVVSFERMNTRAKNRLREAGFGPGDEAKVAEMHADELLRIPEFGRRSLAEVSTWLARAGHTLAPAPPSRPPAALKEQDEPLADKPLSARVIAALDDAGIRTVNQLRQAAADRTLERIPNIGRHSMAEIREMLACGFI